MSNIDKRALREAAEKATPGDWKYSTLDCAVTDDTSSLVVVRMDSGHLNDEQSALNGTFIAASNPAVALALLDELEAAKSRIAELSHHLQCAHGFIEHTEAFGHEASNGILCCGDAQWDIDASKSALAAAAKGE